MTYQEILNNRTENEKLLIDYFNKVNVPVNRLEKVEVFNGRNNKCEALRLICSNEEEFNSHKSSFHFATNNGGDFFTYRHLALTITIKDGWN